MLQCKSNVPACFKPHFRVLCPISVRQTPRCCNYKCATPMWRNVKISKTTWCVKFHQKNNAETKTNCWSQQARHKQRLSQWRHPLANRLPLRLPLPTAAGSVCCVPPIAVCKLRLPAFTAGAGRGGGCFGIRELISFWAPLPVTLQYVSVPIRFVIFTCTVWVQWTNMQLTDLGFINTFQATLS